MNKSLEEAVLFGFAYMKGVNPVNDQHHDPVYSAFLVHQVILEHTFARTI